MIGLHQSHSIYGIYSLPKDNHEYIVMILNNKKLWINSAVLRCHIKKGGPLQDCGPLCSVVLPTKAEAHIIPPGGFIDTMLNTAVHGLT